MSESDGLLAGLDDINWAALGHAYGSAEDVPADLRAVYGPDEAARDKAFRRLFCTIFHQGTRYSASPYAVPFLARIAAAGPPSTRIDALWLLTRLAVDWHDEYDLPLGIDTAAWRAAAVSPEENLRWYDEEIATQTDEERLRNLRKGRDHCAAGHPIDAREGALRSYDAVRTELPRLLALLGDPDPVIRTRTAYLLGWYPEEASDILPPLLERLGSERDPVVAATALVTAGLLANDAEADWFLPHLDAEHPLIRWAAATALARLTLLRADVSDGPLTERVIAELAAFGSRPAPQPATDHHQGDLHSYTVRTLLALMPLVRDPDGVLSTIARALRSIDTSGFMGTHPISSRAPDLLHAAFEPDNAGPAAFTDLSPGRQDLLRALAELLPADAYSHWLLESPLQPVLTSLGLPDTGPALRAYCGLPAEEPHHPDTNLPDPWQELHDH
jgi:hypothetical protein